MKRRKQHRVAVMDAPLDSPEPATELDTDLLDVADLTETVTVTDALPEAPKQQAKYKPKFALPETAGAIPTKGSRDSLQTFSTDGDLLDIWERRILNPNYQEHNPIRIKTVGMKLRWINLSNHGRFQRARYEQGWIPVVQSELMDEREIFGVSFTSEGYVCRGEKQGEMLMKIPIAVYRKIQERRSELSAASYKKLKENMGSAGYSHFKDKYGGSAGDQAAEAAVGFVGSVKFGQERISSDVDPVLE
jgi:hypothetical protein